MGSFARERELIERLEFRIASADTSDKLQTILQKFLPALLLKLASEDAGNRNLTIKVCQYINSRLKIDESIQLPIAALSKTFQDSSSPFVKQFSLLFIQQGLNRLSSQDGEATLPLVLRSSVQVERHGQNERRMFAVAMDLLLGVLRQWKPPEPRSEDDEALKTTFNLADDQATIISIHLAQYLLFDPKAPSPGDIDEHLRPIYEKHFANRGPIVVSIANFISTSIFSDAQRFIPATILSVDANAAANSRADTMFKQCDFDLESDDVVDAAFELYAAAKPRLQTRILILLSRSRASVRRPDRIAQIVEAQLSIPATNLEASKLRAAMFAHLVWAIRVNPDMVAVAGRLQKSLREFIEMQGWPSAPNLSRTEAELRARAYESVGLLATSSRQANSDSDVVMNDDESLSTLDLASWLFTSLRCDNTRDIRHSIEESLSRTMSSTSTISPLEMAKFKDMLLWNATAKEGDEDPVYFIPTRSSAQYPAIRFANKVFPFSDVDARVIDLLALSSDRREIVEEAHRGLDPSWHLSNSRIAGIQTVSAITLPTFQQFAERTIGDQTQDEKEAALLHETPALAGIALFSRGLIAAQAWASTQFAIDDEPDWQNKVDATLDNEAKARGLFKATLDTVPDLFIVKLLQLCFDGMAKGSADCGRIALQVASLTTDRILNSLSDASLLNLELATRLTSIRQAACRTTGIVVSARSIWRQAVATSLGACQQWKSAVGQELAAIEVLFLKSAYVLSRAALRSAATSADELFTTMWALCQDIITKSTDKSFRHAAYTAVGQISLCLPTATLLPEGSHDLIERIVSDAKKEDEAAIGCLGRMMFFLWPVIDEKAKTKTLQQFFDMHEIRKSDFQFAVGEALAVTALGFNSSSTLTEFDVDAQRPAEGVKVDLFRLIIDDTLEKSKTTKPALKKATGIWLLSLIQFCTIEDWLKSRLRDCQVAFSRLLTDRDEVVQETGSRGLGLVYEKGDKSLREDLVRDLVQSFTGNSAKISGTVTEETQLFEPGALPTENGQSVTTYKDIVSLAQEMGDPSLVYRFMNLASNNAIWTSRAAFGRFGLSGLLNDSTYLKENTKFYPKLFRYRFDPNPNVQRSMEAIWKALVKDSNATVDENFDIIMEDLLKSIVYGREWRAREASCAAISDLVQGRDIGKYEKYLDEIWRVTFKVLDDVKESVRVAAMKLSRNLTNMLIRNLEVGDGTTARASTMLGHAMPFLLQQMDAGAAKEVQQYAIGTLLDVVKKAPPRSLMIYAPNVLEAFINTLSSLEHESINYLHLNADKYGLTAEKLDNMRVSSIGASPVTEAIEKCLDSLAAAPATADGVPSLDDPGEKVSPLNDAMKRLEASFKVTIGLPSKVGLSRTMITLVVRHHVMFRPYVDKFVRLTRKNVLDRNATISQSFSTALAYLLRLASEKEVRQTIAYAQKLYFDSEDVSHRSVAGEIVQATSKASNDVFKYFASSFLTFAFIGRNDIDEGARNRFDAAWKDNVGGSRALHLYLKEIVDLARTHIKSSLWPIRHTCCFAVADLVATMESTQDYGKDEAALLWPLIEESLSGKTWEGKEKVVLAFPKFVKQARVIWPDESKKMQTIAIREAKRTNKFYRPHALYALAEFARVRLDLDLSVEVVPYLVEVVAGLVDDSDAMDVDSVPTKKDRSNECLLDESLSSAITCSFAVLRHTSPVDVLDQSLGIVEKARAQKSRAVELCLCHEAKWFIEKITEVKDEKGASGKSEEAVAATSTGPTLSGANHGTGRKFERFLQALVLALLSDSLSSHASETESLRSARINLASKLAHTELLSEMTRETLDQVFVSWLEHERSRPLRQSISDAAQANKHSMGK